jgi:DNA repair exonuclease SbcCD ATPase subunit
MGPTITAHRQEKPMSPSNLPRALIEVAYAEYAREYLRSLPPEHFMEATAQATQRKITLESLDLVHAHRSDVQVFNELLVQYPKARQRRPGQVVPDNMVVVWPEPIKAEGSFDTPLQPVGPFWTLEYVSKANRRKDYEDSFKKYERDLKVPYYLAFYPDNQELTLFHLRGSRYRSVPPDEQGRHGIAELDLEVGLRDGWVRFWYHGELLPLPADLQRDLDETRRQLRNEKRRAEREKHRADQEKERAEQEQARAEEQRQRAEQERARANEEKRQAEQERRRAEEAVRRLAELQRQLDQERQARAVQDRELEQLRSRAARPPTRPGNGR